MSTTEVRSAAEYESRLRDYWREAAEEGRAVRVGEKTTSEQAAIIARYADLFSRGQLDSLRGEHEAAAGDDRERLYRLAKTCEEGLVELELAERDDALTNAILATTVTYRGEEMPLRNAEARLAVEPGYRDRNELGELEREASARLNPERVELLRAREDLQADISGEPDPVARSEEEKQLSLHELEAALRAGVAATTESYARLGAVWFERLLGPDRDDVPPSVHLRWIRRLSPLEATYTREQAIPVCLETVRALGFDLNAIPNIKLDVEDRPQKSPRACVIPADPPQVVHLITRAQGGISDYDAFLHEAGHALHYAGCDPRLPYTFRQISRDHALTEIYSFLVESVVREPGWHALHFGLSDAQAAENTQATMFVESLMYRRYSAKLRYELGFWGAFAEERGDSPRDYATLLTEATGLGYDPRGYVSDMDAGFYSADYLRAWIRAAQVRAHLRREVGEDWWRSEATGELLRGLFAEGTRPTSEEVAGRLGFDPLDTGPLVAELNAA
ncbi:MAG TPA: hypothetical protein VHD91_11640 [Gaiellaceae bacterium]|nr:hypothetical protein [Gaiellaceae bacterium]